MDYIKRIAGVAIGGAALAFAVPLFVAPSADAAHIPYPYTKADSIYCQTLNAWNHSGIPGVVATHGLARTALRAEGVYRRTGTALVTAIVAGGSFRPEADAALTACRLRIVKAGS